MGDWLSTFGIEATKLAIAAVFGIIGKVFYDRRFSTRPNLIYEFQPPATFGTGEKETIHQNLKVTNEGTAPVSNVRIAFKGGSFDQLEHQIIFEGPHSKEYLDDRCVIVLDNLPPKDSATIYFVFSPLKAMGRSVDNFLLSVRGNNCLGQPRASSQSSSLTEWISSLVVVVLLASFAFYVVSNLVFSRPKPGGMETLITQGPEFPLPSGTPRPGEGKGTKILHLLIQAPEIASKGSRVDIDFFVENMSDDPFTGRLSASGPDWSEWPLENYLYQTIALGGKKRVSIRWKFKIPENAPAGRYEIRGQLYGRVFGISEMVDEAVKIQVK